MRLSLLFIVGLATSVAPAAEIFSTFGPEGTVNPAGYGVRGSGGMQAYGSFASGFSVPEDARLARIRLGLRQSTAGAAVIELRADASGTIGSLIEQWSITSSSTDYPPLLSLDSALNPQLKAGVAYWLVAKPVDLSSATAYAWHVGLSNTTGPVANVNGVFGPQYDYYTGQRAAFAIESVPEPATLLIVSAGFLLCARRRR